MEPTEPLVTISLTLSLRGGKGGFGSLLRGGPAGGKKVKIDKSSSRDLSGRRIRDVEAEKQLAEWVAKAPEREAAKKAEKERRRSERKQDEYQPDTNKIIGAAIEAVEAAKTSIEIGLQQEVVAAQETKKRKAEEEKLAERKVPQWDPFLQDLSSSDEE